MKNVLSKFMFLMLGISLITGCSSNNTQSQNTGIGAATGAVVGGLAGSLVGAGTGRVVAIAAGAVAGGLIGGYAGRSMDSSDKTKMDKAMTSNPPQKSSHWKNTKTHTSYNVMPTSKTMTYNGRPNCRTYTATTTAPNGKKTVTNGTACQQTDGSWQTMES
jgi:surface antigen